MVPLQQNLRKVGEPLKAFHDTGVANGSKSIENDGWREGASGEFCLAYLRDASGNKICAVHRTGMRRPLWVIFDVSEISALGPFNPSYRPKKLTSGELPFARHGSWIDE